MPHTEETTAQRNHKEQSDPQDDLHKPLCWLLQKNQLFSSPVSFPSLRRAPAHHWEFAQDGRGFASKDTRTHHYFAFKARAKQCFEENIFTNLSQKQKRRAHRVINRQLSATELHQGKSVSFSSFGAQKPETPQRRGGLPRGTHSDSAPSDLLINSIHIVSAGKYDGL